MKYSEYFRTGYLPRIIEEYMIMDNHEKKLRVYLAHMLADGWDDYENRVYLHQMRQIMAQYKAYLSRAKP